MTQIADNLAAVRERMGAAARRSGRDFNSIKLMAVCKMQTVAAIRAAYEAGQRLFGENRVQEFQEKSVQVRELASGSDGVRFHLIGHLQSNKTNLAAELFDAIDSVDSLHVMERLNMTAQRMGKAIPVLLEINIGGEAQKPGLPPDCAELNEILLAAPKFPGTQICGLMAVPPYIEDPEKVRPYFRKLRELRERIASRRLTAVEMSELSMGMSHDFEVAIEEGSTCVRVGSAIFGARNYA